MSVVIGRHFYESLKGKVCRFSAFSVPARRSLVYPLNMEWPMTPPSSLLLLMSVVIGIRSLFLMKTWTRKGKGKGDLLHHTFPFQTFSESVPSFPISWCLEHEMISPFLLPLFTHRVIIIQVSRQKACRGVIWLYDCWFLWNAFPLQQHFVLVPAPDLFDTLRKPHSYTPTHPQMYMRR